MMEPKRENQPAAMRPVVYKPLPAQYRPYNPSEQQKRKLERYLKKKRS